MNKSKKKYKINKSTSNTDNFDIYQEIESINHGKQKTYKKISRKKPGEKSPNYFTAETQEHIIKYQNTVDINERNKLYLDKIYPAFDALVENLINVYGFTVAYDSRNDLKHECLEFLYETLPKFNADKGSKAFSYFNVVAMHWLTIKSKNNVKKVQSYISIDDKDAISQHDLNTIEGYNVVPSGDEIMFLRNQNQEIKAIISTISDNIKTDNEKNCIRAINILLDNLDEIDFLNKRALLLFMREITGLNPKQLSIVLASLKKHYKEVKQKDDKEIY